MLFSDPYVCMARCAEKTRTIKLGTGVTNPSSRIAPVTANSFATINALAPGRVILGIGTGNTARRTLGMPAARLDDMRDHIRICADLLAGRETDYTEGDRHRRIKFLNPDGGWYNIEDPVPVYVAASGPKSLSLAGEIADGVILFGAVSPVLIDFVMKHVRAGAEQAGRDPNDIYTLCMTALHVTQPGESLETSAVRQAVGPFVSSSTNIFALSNPDPDTLPAELRDDILGFRDVYRVPEGPIETRHLEMYADYLLGFKKEHENVVTEKIIRATTLTGTPGGNHRERGEHARRRDPSGRDPANSERARYDRRDRAGDTTESERVTAAMATNPVSADAQSNVSTHGAMDAEHDETVAQIRDTIQRVLEDFDGEYWRAKDRERAYPTEFRRQADGARPARVAHSGRIRWQRSAVVGRRGNTEGDPRVRRQCGRVSRADVHDGHRAASRQ